MAATVSAMASESALAAVTSEATAATESLTTACTEESRYPAIDIAVGITIRRILITIRPRSAGTGITITYSQDIMTFTAVAIGITSASSRHNLGVIRRLEKGSGSNSRQRPFGCVALLFPDPEPRQKEPRSWYPAILDVCDGLVRRMLVSPTSDQH